MRIVKLSGKVFGFDTVGGCKAYFEHVLPWQKGYFGFAGEGHKVAKDKLSAGENIIFSYNGQLIAIAKAKGPIIYKEKVIGIDIDIETIRIFKSEINSCDLEKVLKGFGYNDAIYGGRGWNILNGKYEKAALEFIRDEEWKIYMI